MYYQSNNWWRFRKILWPSQNIWTLNHDLICGCQKIRSVWRVLGIHNFVSLLHSPVLNSLRGKLRKNLIIIFEDCNRDSAHWVDINFVRGFILLCLCIFTSFFCNFHSIISKYLEKNLVKTLEQDSLTAPSEQIRT